MSPSNRSVHVPYIYVFYVYLYTVYYYMNILWEMHKRQRDLDKPDVLPPRGRFKLYANVTV
jgi:hypothetical protein